MSRLLNLPPEIHGIILKHLSREHSPSVRAFAGVSRYCHALARPQIFETLKITVKDSEGLGDLVESLQQTLERNEGHKFVKRLEVDGELTYPPDDAWQPLATLIERLPSLADLVFLSRNQFPQCMLEALHRHHPTCRLHIHNFLLRSLNDPFPGTYEFQLVTSPCLLSIKTGHNRKLSASYAKLSRDAVMHMVSRLAPNLREVTLTLPIRFVAPGNMPLPPWGGFGLDKEPTTTETPQRGALRHLQIQYPGSLGREDLEAWAEHTDLSVLEILKLGTTSRASLFDYLATEVDFSCLKDLVISGTHIHRSYSAVQRLLRKLRPLSSLTIEDWHEDFVIEDILEPHGPSLIELSLENKIVGPIEPVKQFDLSNIAQSCSSLRYLALALNRTQGNLNEVNLYRTLGSMPQLESVSLSLELWVPWDISAEWDDELNQMVDPSFDDEFDRQIPD